MTDNNSDLGTASGPDARLVFVTGPSGAGRSTGINAFEDLGFEAIDNMPLSLLPRLYDGGPLSRPLALGIDVRNRDFSSEAMIQLIDSFDADPSVEADVIYLDCRPDVLIRRYSETRRRHPLAPQDSPAEGIAREVDLLAPIRARAGVLIDTSEMTPHDLRAEIGRWFAPEGGQQMTMVVESFSYKRGIPRGVDMVLDCRFIANPHWQPELRGLDGREPAVAAFVAADPRYDGFFALSRDLILSLLPAYRDEGKTHFSVGFGCTGGQHRSVAVTEAMANALANNGWQVSKRHRELERRGASVAKGRAGEAQ